MFYDRRMRFFTDQPEKREKSVHARGDLCRFSVFHSFSRFYICAMLFFFPVSRVWDYKGDRLNSLLNTRHGGGRESELRELDEAVWMLRDQKREQQRFLAGKQTRMYYIIRKAIAKCNTGADPAI